MRKLAALFLALLVLSAPAHALTGKVLYIVCDKNGATAENVSAFKVNNTIARVQETQGWDYEICLSSDTNFVKTIWPAGYVFATGDTATGSRYGRYDMAVMLNMPALALHRTAANDSIYFVKHFGHWIYRNSSRAFPIPLVIPFAGAMDVTTQLAAAYTGCISVTTLTTVGGEPYKDEQGDSLYILTTTGVGEALVYHPDSTAFAWCKPLVWRYTAGREAVNTRYAACWMTVGTGNHRVIWLPWAYMDRQSTILPIIFAMFTKVQPIELPIMAYGGRVEIAGMYSGGDTLGYGAGFKAIKDYAVANGMKVELSYYTFWMHSQAVDANNATAVAYATQYPDNIRLIMNSGSSWYPGYYDMLGTTVAANYVQKVKRIKYTQDSCGVYFPIIDTSILDVENGRFADVTTNDSTFTSLRALVNRGITDVYDYWSPSYSASYPLILTDQIVGPHRTWIDDGGTLKELRIHSLNSISRYFLQVSNNADSLKKGYIDFAPEKSLRAMFLSHLVPRVMGLYVYLDASSTDVRATSAASGRAMARAKFATGIYLPTLTYSGGDSSLAWPTGGGGANDQAGQIRANRSLFLDVMKMENNLKKMGDYLVTTYGTAAQEPFKWSWLSDVKWDRKNGRAFPNSHVRME